MIEVRLFANLAPVGRPRPYLASGVAGFETQARNGLTVRDVVTEAAIRPHDVVFVMIDTRLATLDSPLEDGDHLGLFPAVSGG
jgi:molybdopterin converting factor small subunit